MSTIEGGMICTNDKNVYQKARLFRSHGMVRESTDEKFRKTFLNSYPDLNSDFIFAYPAYNVRNTEIGAIIGLSQLKRLDANIKKRSQNFQYFLSKINPSIYRTDFKLIGSSNYAFNLILKNSDKLIVSKLIKKMQKNGIEFRRGSAGGGNQLRQPYLKKICTKKFFRTSEVEHIHLWFLYW